MSHPIPQGECRGAHAEHVDPIEGDIEDGNDFLEGEEGYESDGELIAAGSLELISPGNVLLPVPLGDDTGSISCLTSRH